MKKRVLQFLSVVISSLTILYLLFINVLRDTFIIHDWIVVIVDLTAKLVIEIYILIVEKD